ncbi:MAG: hypothetical protein QXS93_00465 [Candidatus Micrarchaeia archaeon]
MGDSEMIYLEKKVVCKKCGHMHEFNIRTNLSVTNFTFNATCVECGGRIVIDLDSIFKGGKAPEQISSIHDPYLNVDASATSSSTTSNLPLDLDAVDGIDESTSSESSGTSSSQEGQGDGSIFDSNTEPMPDVSSFFDDIEENK